MENRKTATLDLTDCKYLGELHQRIKKALEFPEHYGENWSAFWDSLRFDSPVEHITIVGEHLNYYSGKSNGHRLLWSNDGLFFVTYDHYESFMEVVGG